MRSIVAGVGLLLALVLLAPPSSARNRSTRVTRDLSRSRPAEDFRGAYRFSLDQDPGRYPAAAPGDTVILASYSFDAGSWCATEGWTSIDHTAQIADFFHVAQATGGAANELNGGDFGRLVPLRGNKSLWCGAYADYPVTPPATMCRYWAMPGYGNTWDQTFSTRNCLSVGPGVSVTFIATWDSEPGYDGFSIEADRCDDNWVPAGPLEEWGGMFDGIAVDSLHTQFIPDSLHSGSLRIRIHFESDGAWSDQDGLWDTDGAVIIDSLSVSDVGGLALAVEDFEDDAEGATVVDDWEAGTPPGYGDYSGLVNGTTVVQEDPCRSEITCMWAFFNGSSANYACGGFPAQAAMPYGNERDQYMWNGVVSPLIPWVGAGNRVELQYTAYRDLPLDNLQFYSWGIASLVDGCLSSFQDREFVYYGGQKDWITSLQPIGDLIRPGASHVQLEFHAFDMCGVWCGVYGSGTCHSHAPLIDTIELRRIEIDGPQWSVRDLDLFQDTFAEDGSISSTSTGRADSANDVNPSAVLAINPGDSMTVRVSDVDYGLAGDPFTGFGAAVYAYISVLPQGQASKEGGALTQDSFRWPAVDGFDDAAGIHWTVLRMDTSFTSGINRSGAQPDAFCIDLNDNLFTVGDTIQFAFGAQSATTGTRSYWTPFVGTTVYGSPGGSNLQEALDAPGEFQILPGGGFNNGGDILYVDGMNRRGAQPYFDTAFEFLGIDDQVDRYDIRAPSSGVANRPGARVKNVFNQIIAPYRVIIWNTGDLSQGLIGDGTGNPEKSDDAFVLFTFIDQKPNTGGIYFSGDDIADELYNKWNPGGSLVNLRGYIQGAVNPGDNDANAAGFGTAPLGVGEPNSCFDHFYGTDQLVAYGGCPLINDFDVITPQGTSVLQMNYGGAPGQGKGAIISQYTNNSAGAGVGIILSGFSFHYIRDASPATVPARVHHLEDILIWMQDGPNPPVGQRTASTRYSLRQNYPNPFNPVTSIAFTVRERTPVTLRIYNAAGQLVRTLVDDTRAPGVVHTVEWDGRNNAGQAVSSGVYFYRLVTKGFTQTRKMVLLK